MEETGQEIVENKKLVNLDNLTLEELRSLVDEKDTFKNWLNSEKDAHFSKSLNTWKENNLAKEVEKEVAKRYPAETKEQSQLREMQLKIEKMELETQRKDLSNKALVLANEKKLDASLIDFVIADNEENTVARLNKLDEVINNLVNARLEEKYKASAATPNTSVGDAIVNNYDKFAQQGDVFNMLKHRMTSK